MKTNVSKKKVLLVKSISILGLIISLLALGSRYYEDSRFLNTFHNATPLSLALFATALVLSLRFEKEAERNLK